MKIGIVLPSLPGYSETFFQNKIKGLEANGHKVILFINKKSNISNNDRTVKYAPELSGNFMLNAIRAIFALCKTLIFSFKSVYKFWNLEKLEGTPSLQIVKLIIINSHILNSKLDWLHFGFATMGINRELVGKAIGAKVAVSFRGYDIYIYPLKHKNPYSKLWKHIDRVHTISNSILNEAYKLGLPSKIAVSKITPAIDISKFSSKGISASKKATINILTVGRLHWIKGLEYIIEAIAIVKERGFEVKYEIAGEGHEYERLIYITSELGLKNEVKFLGKVSHEDVAILMKNNSFYIQYSEQEGFCNAVLEAQASGMICIVSNAGGLAENILHEETGWVVPKRNPLLLAEQIIRIVNMEIEILEKIKFRAVERVNNEFNFVKQKLEFESFYNS